jgi:dihydrofolate reductase
MLTRPLILYIAMSLDGYIATPEGDISFLSMVESPPEDYGYMNFIAGVDTIILGRKTYEKVAVEMGLDWASIHPDKKTYVLTRTSKISDNPNLIFYTGDLTDLVQKIKSETGKNIYCDGGGETVRRLLSEKLIDECIISIIPVLLGDGIRLFTPPYPRQALELLQSTAYPSGLLQTHYRLKK